MSQKTWITTKFGILPIVTTFVTALTELVTLT